MCQHHAIRTRDGRAVQETSNRQIPHRMVFKCLAAFHRHGGRSYSLMSPPFSAFLDRSAKFCRGRIRSNPKIHFSPVIPAEPVYGRNILTCASARCEPAIGRPLQTSEASMADPIDRILCISSYEKGQDFLRACAEAGVRTTLLTVDKLRHANWPYEALEELATMPEDLTSEQVLNTVSWMARGRRFDRVVALDEFDQEIAATIREHMRLPGMGVTTTAFYRDKLAMRTGARNAGFRVPEFCRVLNYDELRDYMARVPAPWLLKPRTSASALGIRKIHEPE